VSRFWRAWPYRHVAVVDGHFDGLTGTVLDSSVGRVVVALDAMPESPSRVVKLEKRQLRPLPTPSKDAHRSARVRTGTRSG
jgi:hypothetical protein